MNVNPTLRSDLPPGAAPNPRTCQTHSYGTFSDEAPEALFAAMDIDDHDAVLEEDEKKPFDEHHVKEEDDLQPDPDETLMMEQRAGRVWSVKVSFQLISWTLYRA